MTDTRPPLSILLVEDDAENLELLLATLPDSLDGYPLIWDPCGDFEEAIKRVEVRRYDAVVTDIYRDRKGRRKIITETEEKARDIIEGIRGKRFCPIVVFTDGSYPASFQPGTFIKYADKSGGNDQILSALKELLATGVPTIARKLHDELDRLAGSYLWDFLSANWARLSEKTPIAGEVLERLVRRRASVQVARLLPSAECLTEVRDVEALEFYIYPPISRNEFRLGEILRHKKSTREGDSSTDEEPFVIVLTPHCHLAIQPGDNAPRAEYVLVVKTLNGNKLLNRERGKAISKAKSIDDKMAIVRRSIKSPPDVGRPAGRYWFLPGFLDIPDLYCDFLQVESVPYQVLNDENQYERIAVLDTPFAEAFQASFTGFYSAVGLPNQKPERFGYLVGIPGSDSTGGA